MREPATQELPEPQKHVSGRVTLYLNPELASSLLLGDLFALPTALVGLTGEHSRQRGRATVWRWRPDWYEGRALHVRQYAHGGTLGPLLGVRFLSQSRMVDELRASLHAHAVGVPTALPVGVRIESRAFGLVVAHFISEALPDTANLLEVCRTACANGGLSPATRGKLARALASAVATMHNAGIVHADLNLKNLLCRLRPGEASAYVVDFDKARVRSKVDFKARAANLRRLARSVSKWPASCEMIGLLDRVRFVRTYLAHCPQVKHEPRAAVRRLFAR